MLGKKLQKERKRSHFSSDFKVLGGVLSLGHLSDNWGRNVLFKLFQNLFYVKAPCLQWPLGGCVGVSCGGAGFCQCCSIMRTVCRKWMQPQIPPSRGLQAAFLAVFSLHTFSVWLFILTQKRQWAWRCDGSFGDFLFVCFLEEEVPVGNLLCINSLLQQGACCQCASSVTLWVWTPHSATVTKQIFPSSS